MPKPWGTFAYSVFSYLFPEFMAPKNSPQELYGDAKTDLISLRQNRIINLRIRRKNLNVELYTLQCLKDTPKRLHWVHKDP